MLTLLRSDLYCHTSVSTLDISSANLTILLDYIFIRLQKPVFKALLSFKIIGPKIAEIDLCSCKF